MLDAEAAAFDQEVKDTIEHYEAPYNAGTWPILDARMIEAERTRRRLVTAKVLEIAAILIVLFTFYNFFPVLRSAVIDTQETPERTTDRSVPMVSVLPMAPEAPVEAVTSRVSVAVEQAPVPETAEALLSHDAYATGDQGPRNGTALPVPLSTAAISYISTNNPERTAGALQLHPGEDRSLVRVPRNQFAVTGLNSVLASDITTVPGIVPLVAPIPKTSSGVRFGMSAAADVNTLFMPHEHFYSQGRSIHFSEKEIVAGGYTAGASLLFDSKHFLFETGLTYSSKNFSPGRKLFIGTSADQHELDFENISLNIISIPLYLHWKIDGKGLWRVYSVGGLSMHVIASAHYDFVAENLFTSSAAPQDPMLLQNQNEIQRVREHMLDGSKFSTKGYLTAVGGLGVERYMTSRMSIFAQPMYQYQIPFFGLIDQNGKHLKNGTLLLGTRISL
jgi:hypothetical protein